MNNNFEKTAKEFKKKMEEMQRFATQIMNDALNNITDLEKREVVQNAINDYKDKKISQETFNKIIIENAS